MQTLMIHIGGIGDFILTCPAIKALSQLGPVALVGYPDRLQLAVDAGIAVSAQSLDEIGFDSVFTEPNERLREAVSKASRIIIWMHDADGTIQKGMESITDAPVEVYSPLPHKAFQGHATEHYTHCLGLHIQPPFRWTPASIDEQHDIVIHPGSGDLKKNWPLEQFEALAEALMEKERAVTWCIGPAERERMPRIPDGAFLECVSLSTLAQKLSAAQLFIGNDSGITHLSASLSVPTLALFSTTNPDIWAPLGEQVTVLQQRALGI